MARDPKRIERILYKIGKLWTLHPDMRFFQLLYNYTQLGTRDKLGTVRDPFYYEDDDTEAFLDAVLEKMEEEKKRSQYKRRRG